VTTKFIIDGGSVTSPFGFVAGAAATGMKKGGAFDVTLIVSKANCTAAALFSKNKVQAAPVLIDREVLAKNPDRIRGVIGNAKYANACTGQQGLDAARLTQRQAATLLNCAPDQLFVLSTGVIGQQMPLDKIGQGIEIAALSLSADHGVDAAKAIMTTDTRPKHLAVRVPTTLGDITIGGMAKGAGMIHPNMATMLAVITTDAAIDAPMLQRYLTDAGNVSFNRISIDGDSSTNDTVLLLANGASCALQSEPDKASFVDGLNFVCTELAQMIVRDGEGATKFVEIQVNGADSPSDAHQVANTIATSPLVKTAFAGSDANWGRILAAAGRAGVEFDQNQTNLWFSADGENWLHVLSHATPTDFVESDAAAIFAASDIWVRLSVGNGDGVATVWTCDLTHEYVSINADYRT
jgi:glutamate N-acetyltransferase/amino-acid N-acetyltransferase